MCVNLRKSVSEAAQSCYLFESTGKNEANLVHSVDSAASVDIISPSVVVA
jgi:hypothetical protein